MVRIRSSIWQARVVCGTSPEKYNECSLSQKTISNRDLWQRTGQEPVHVSIKRRRWKWIGHTLRKEHSIARSALDWNPEGKRKRGRPKNTWRRGLQSDLDNSGMTWGEAKQRAKNRTRWRTAVDALCPLWDE